MGTADLACPSLIALAEHPQCEVVGVYTQPDRPAGRGQELRKSPVKDCAEKLALQILQPKKLHDPSAIKELAALEPDLIVVAAYGQILPPAILELPTHGCLNIHASLLPRHRGAAPIQWAILEGDAETGVTLMQMDKGLDTGEKVATKCTPIHPEDNAQTLHDRLAEMGAKLLTEKLNDFLAGKLPLKPQPEEGVTYARKIDKADGQIDWTQPAVRIERQIRALTPWPGAFTSLPTEKQCRLKITEAILAEGSGPTGVVLDAGPSGIVIACGEDALSLKTIQREGAKKMTAAEFLRGFNLETGAMMGGTSSASSQK